MRGKVISYDDTQATGLISGDDGVRYPFMRGDLMGGVRSVVVGSTVDFEAADGKAVSVYIVQSAFNVDLGGKNKWIAALLACPLLLGVFGIHKFYLGRIGAGVIMLLCSTLGAILVLPIIAMWVVALIEMIAYLSKTEPQFHDEYVAGDKAWF